MVFPQLDPGIHSNRDLVVLSSPEHHFGEQFDVYTIIDLDHSLKPIQLESANLHNFLYFLPDSTTETNSHSFRLAINIPFHLQW